MAPGIAAAAAIAFSHGFLARDLRDLHSDAERAAEIAVHRANCSPPTPRSLDVIFGRHDFEEAETKAFAVLFEPAKDRELKAFQSDNAPTLDERCADLSRRIEG